MSKIVFGTDGWRAIVADEFTFANVRLVTQALAEYLLGEKIAGKGIIIGYDNRFLAEEFAQATAEVLTGNGIKVFMTQEPTPTPVLAYAVKENQCGGAVMLTASHNPPQYNGIKFIPHYAGPALPPITKAIEEKLAEVISSQKIEEMPIEQALSRGLVSYLAPKESYLEHLKNLVDLESLAKAKLKVVVDPMHGVGSGYTDEFLAKAGCQVAVIRGERDAFFGGSLPEPTAKNLQALKEAMFRTGAQLGLANDGDADRFGVIDGSGNYLSPNQVLVLLTAHLLQKGQRGTIVRTVATTHMLDKMAQKYGLEVLETPVGFKYIGGAMLDMDVLIGGEESGGLTVKGHIPEKDGILADCLIAEMAAVSGGKTLTEILEELEKEFGSFYSERIDIHCTQGEKEEILQKMKNLEVDRIDGITVERKTAVDGLKIVLEDQSWFLMRPSGTENLIRLYAEAESKERVAKLQRTVKELLGI